MSAPRITIADILAAAAFFAGLVAASWAWGLILTGGN